MTHERGSACGVAVPSSICRHPPATHTHKHTHTHMHTLTPDLCIYALRRHSSKGHGWRGLGESRTGEKLFGLQTETDGVLGGVGKQSIGDRRD